MGIKVLYYSAVDLADLKQTNGGNLCCRNHLFRLKEDADLEVHVVLAGRADLAAANLRFLTEFGAPHVYVPFRHDRPRLKRFNVPGRIANWYRRRFNYPFNYDAWQQRHVEEAVLAAYHRWRIDVVIVDYLPSMLYCTGLIKEAANVILITLNREAEFYRDVLQCKLTAHTRITGLVSQWRWARYERHVHRNVKQVVAIGPPDLPRGRGLRSRPVCVTPYLDPKPEPWSFADSRAAFFVGNINHYPNRLAIEWIATQLVPRVHRERPDLRVLVLGADEAQTPAPWRHGAITYLGAGDRERTDRLFRTADLMLCPIANDFGMKFKAAEAIAYGTPMLASRQTLVGIPYLRDVPSLDLDNPEAAARLMCALVGQRPALERLSEQLLRQSREFRATQKDVWSRLIRSVLARDEAGNHRSG
ncbi:MAG: glycosyltransferase [Gemmataceae bacterium]|nr:glycosyltransferase [Gemmataceae bacterium]